MSSQITKYHLLHLGVGQVGGALLKQLSQNRRAIERSYGLQLIYCGLFTAHAGKFRVGGLSEADLTNFPGPGSQANIDRCLKLVPKPFILVDTTASDETINWLKLALKRGGAVVLSNKKPLAGSQKTFNELHKLAEGRLFYETTVGAGLPVIQTLKTLRATGDEITEIQACLSGTLGFIFWQLENGVAFSKAVAQAKELGFTEPDPRDDLSGADVARKVLILSRLLGRQMELSEVRLKKLYPRRLESLPTEKFLKQLSELDDFYAAQAQQARRAGQVLRFMATIKKNSCQVGLQAVNRDSDVGNLQGPDNIIVFTSQRYRPQPLVIKGPGAGIEVTAAGVFGDILRASGRL